MSSVSRTGGAPGIVAVMRVAPDGPMAFAVTPIFASSIASVCVSPTIAAFAVA